MTDCIQCGKAIRFFQRRFNEFHWNCLFELMAMVFLAKNPILRHEDGTVEVKSLALELAEKFRKATVCLDCRHLICHKDGRAPEGTVCEDVCIACQQELVDSSESKEA